MNLNFDFDFAFGVFVGIALTILGLIAFEHYEMWQERKRRKIKDEWK